MALRSYSESLISGAENASSLAKNSRKHVWKALLQLNSLRLAYRIKWFSNKSNQQVIHSLKCHNRMCTLKWSRKKTKTRMWTGMHTAMRNSTRTKKIPRQLNSHLLGRCRGGHSFHVMSEPPSYWRIYACILLLSMCRTLICLSIWCKSLRAET